MVKYYKFGDKVYKVYKTSSDSFHVKESEVQNSLLSTFIYAGSSLGLIWYVAKIFSLI